MASNQKHTISDCQGLYALFQAINVHLWTELILNPCRIGASALQRLSACLLGTGVIVTNSQNPKFGAPLKAAVVKFLTHQDLQVLVSKDHTILLVCCTWGCNGAHEGSCLLGNLMYFSCYGVPRHMVNVHKGSSSTRVKID